MADAVVNTILRNIASFSVAEMKIVGDLKNELQKMESSLSSIQAVLQDAERKQRKSEGIKIWLRDLKAVAYDIENTLDEFATEALGRRLHPGVWNQASRFFSLRNPLFHRLKTAHRLRTLRESLDFIAEGKQQFHLTESGDPEAGELEWRQTSSQLPELETFGRDQEVEDMVRMLINQVRDNDHTSVVSICGMGGLGKTTLAQLVCNDKRVVGVFNSIIWVCVSDEFNIGRLTRAIIESIEGNPCTIQELDPLQRRLQGKLMGKRFLLVLDDVWNKDEEKWRRLKGVFRCGAKGSSVVVTTRIDKIALMMSTEPVHYLGRLLGDDSWNLFKRRAFGRSDCGEYSHLEVIGKEIVKKCGGVPLAIEAMGSLMKYKKSKTEWLSVKQSELWDLEDEDRKVLPVLRLSYDNLLPHLRQCFAFCSVFPKDYDMSKEQLIQLWMANGFIPSRPHKDLHDVGCEIFNELTARSFFMDVKEEVNGKISCRMHDLIHDLASSITGDECFRIDVSGKVQKHVHHLSIFQSSGREAPLKLDLSKFRSLQSMLVFDDYSDDIRISLNSSTNRFLRALALRNRHLTESIVVHAYKQLRYLDFSYSGIKVLSNSICCLPNLQTINLRCCYELEMLPEDMNHMKELVYLDITKCHSLNCLPVSMGKLVHLRKLSIFIVGKENGYGIDELQGLDLLGGELHIKQLENVNDVTEARSANLMGKQNLRSLELSWGREISRNIVPRESEEDVFSGLQPHPNLKKLTITGFQGVRLPFWMSEAHLPNLIEFELHCERCEKLPPLGKLRFLEVLKIEMNSLQFIWSDLYGDSENSFPSLKYLRISARALKEWKTIEGRENFPRQRELTISGSRQLSEGPTLPSLKELDVSGCSISFLKAVENFTSITSLCIWHVDELPNKWLKGHRFLESLEIGSRTLKSVSIQFDDLCALRFLTFEDCWELEALPEGLGKLTSLRTLRLSHCDSLVSLPANSFCGLSSLSRMWIQNCKKLRSLSDGMQYLTALEELSIIGCPEVTSLPDSIGYLTALRELRIWDCEGLTALPNEVDQLTSLSTLQIMFCPNLICLPDGLQNLATLSVLVIHECPHLERRCEKDRGEDWPKITHIPQLHIQRFGSSASSPPGNLMARLRDCISRLWRGCSTCFTLAHDQ